MFLVCPYGRIHTNFTGMVRELRKELIVKKTGERFVSLDVANSQPYFMIEVLGLCKTGAGIQEGERGQGQGQQGVPYDKSNGYDFSTQSYIQKAVKGDFWTDFKLLPDLDPASVKKHVFEVLFGRACDMVKSPVSALFQELYPTVYRLLLAEKQRGVGRKKHKHLARTLQRIESDAIILGVCGRLARDYPKVPVLTVHDNIITTPEYEGLVREMMEEECDKIVGLRPTIRKD